MTVFIAKDLGTQVVSNLDFMKRSGIYWNWGSKPFSGHSFGSTLGPVHCFFQAGFHDFAHCVDFIMRGKQRRITPSGLNFRTYWEKWIPALGIFDGDPKSAQMTQCEGRVFALQAYLMQREMGFAVEFLDSDEERSLRSAGQLDHLPASPTGEERTWGRDFSLLKSMTVEEFALHQGRLETFKWRDDDVFLRQYGYGYDSGLPYKERKQRWKECFSQFILEEYQRLQTPEVEREISRAITKLGERLRRFHRDAGFVPGEQHIGLRHAPGRRPAKQSASSDMVLAE